ncbi:MAG: serine hydrolase, partial [Candidatus Lokiarchaeota archaeon]
MKNKFEKLHDIITMLMQKFKVPGLAISIVHNGEIIYEKGFGARNLEENFPMTQDTLIGIGSISKSFTALLILKLQEEGLLNIDDPVCNYLELEPFLSHQDITIAHLLSHSSGIPSVDGQWSPIAISFGDYQRIYPVTSQEDYLHYITHTKDEIYFKPGEEFFYNNDMYTILGLIIEKITGKSFENFLREKLLDPLDMNRTTLNRETLEKDPSENYIRGYLHKGKGEERHLEHPKLPFSKQLQAPGGIYTSMHELANYGKFLLKNGSFKEKRLITPESIEIACTPKINSLYGYGKNPKYCFGWVKEEDVFDHTIMHHGGGLGVSTSFFGFIPESNLAVSVAENDDMGIVGIIGMCAFSLMLDKDPKSLIDQYRILDIFYEIEGEYTSSLGLYKLKVFLKSNSIYIEVESDDG